MSYRALYRALVSWSAGLWAALTRVPVRAVLVVDTAVSGPGRPGVMPMLGRGSVR